MGQALVILGGRACQTAGQGEIKQCSVRLALFGSVLCAFGLRLNQSRGCGWGVAGSTGSYWILGESPDGGVTRAGMHGERHAQHRKALLRAVGIV